MEALHPLASIRQASPLVLAVLGLNPGTFTLQGTNTYVVGAGPSRILLDTGEGVSGYGPLLLGALRSAGVSQLSHVLCTHRHHDHIGGIQQVLDVVAALGQDPSTVQIHKRSTPRDSASASPARPFLDIAHGQVFETQGATLTAIHTPGHTDDHTAFRLGQENAIFTGDCVLGQGSAVFEDLGQLLASLRGLADLTPGRLYPGHGPVVEEGTPKIVEYIRHRLEREAQILAAMRARQPVSGQAWTLADLAAAIYKGYPPAVLPAAERSIAQHLHKLEADGVVVGCASDRDGYAQDGQSVRAWRLA
ncbi:beta-lactamase-like protein [Entophlyctis helioformis]|nr:beta-lactamase-like protein [Entophlyctis helioformis]